MTLTLALQIMTIATVLLVPFSWNGKQPGMATCVGVVMFTASYFISNIWQLSLIYLEQPQAYGFALRLHTLSRLLLVAIYVGIIFAWLTKKKPIVIDTQAKLVWLVLLIAEGWSVVEYLECKLFTDPFGAKDYLLSHIWGVEVSRFACGRRFGPIAPYIAPVITSLYMIWINYRASSIGRSDGSD